MELVNRNIYFDPKEYDTETLIKILNEWSNNPASHPEIEKWYEVGMPPIVSNKTKERLEYEEYSRIFDQARGLQAAGAYEQSIALYYYILSKYKPVGMSYYEEPASLLIGLTLYDESIGVYNMALDNIHVFSGPTKEAVLREFPLNIDKCITLKKAFLRVTTIIAASPGILQSDLLLSLPEHDTYDLKNIIYSLAKAGKLKKVKQGRSFRLHLN
jgi:hypothetical protein